MCGRSGKYQREVQEQRRQHHDGDRVSPVEDPVHPIESAAEREREQAEEGHRQPEEMQRCLIGGPTSAHRRADQQRENPDRGEDVVIQAGAVRHRRQRHVGHFLRPKPQQRVDVTVTDARLVLQGEHVGAALDRLGIDREQNVARPHARPARSRWRGDFRRHHSDRALDPQHAVFNFAGSRTRHDIRQAERQQAERHRHGQRRLPPLAPPRLSVVLHRARFVEFAQQERSIRGRLEQTVYRGSRRSERANLLKKRRL